MALMDLASITISSSGDFSVITGKAGFFQMDKAADVSIIGITPTVSVIRHKTVILPLAGIDIIPNVFNIRTSIRKLIEKITPVKRSWQARLGTKMDDIYKKSMDNTISLSSYPIDMVRVQVTRDPRTQDLISRTIIASEVMPIFFEEPFTDLPLRRMEYADTENIIMTIDGTKLSDIKVKCPISETLNRGDLLFRIIRDDYSERPVVLILQVKDELGTIGYSKLIQINYVLSYYDEKLPESVISAVIDSTEKREVVQW